MIPKEIVLQEGLSLSFFLFLCPSLCVPLRLTVYVSLLGELFEIKQSTIAGAGEGLFCKRDINAGQKSKRPSFDRLLVWRGVVWCCNAMLWDVVAMPGTLIESKEYDDIRGSGPRGQYVVEVQKKPALFLDAFTHPSYARKANMFSMRNSTGNNADIKCIKKKVYVVIRKKLKAGDEVFVNYGMKYWKNFPAKPNTK